MNIGVHGSFSIGCTYRMPQLFRYMNKSYVDEFLLEGKLRLGSYSKYRDDDHPERGDKSEGKALLFAHLDNAFVAAEAHIPNNSYVLCTSAISSQEVMAAFDSDDCFVISDPCIFAAEIAKNIPGCQKVLIGGCNYNGAINRYFPQVSALGASENHEVKMFLDAILADEVFFHKPVKFRNQFEYRFVFVTDRIVDDYKDIISMKAAALCMRLKGSSF